MKPLPFQKDTGAWIVQIWCSFLAALFFSAIAILYLPTENTTKGFLAVSYLFTISSSFTLAKTIRNNQKAGRLTSRIDEARVEKILAEHNLIERP
ncbi:MAG: YiaA/YiaB family inner membrane protein [Pseudanabaenaceae cyanobacterium]